MNTKEAIKAGFLMRCADEGLDLEQAEKRAESLLAGMEKSAFDPVAAGIGLVRTAAGLGVLGLAGSGALGMVGGHLLARAQRDPLGAEEVRSEAVEDTYQRLISQIRQDTKLRRMQALQKGPRRGI
jgi:hypothetical protein